MENTASLVEPPCVSTDLRHTARFQWHPMAVIGLVIFGLIVLASIFAPLLTTYDPTSILPCVTGYKLPLPRIFWGLTP